MDDLDWYGNGEFRAAELKPWYYTDKKDKKKEKKKGGMWKIAQNGKFAFASVDQAGHLVPMDQPAASEALVQRWVEWKGGF